jgi:hypothetical protein
MRTDEELLDIAFLFVADCRVGQSIDSFANELESLGAHGAAIPKVKKQKWIAVLDRLVSVGKLRCVGELLAVPIEQQDFKQMSLF